VAAISGSDWRPEPTAAGYTERREAMINTLADAIDDHVELPRLLAGTRISHRL
jgi:adenosylcobyric acid synthase